MRYSLEIVIDEDEPPLESINDSEEDTLDKCITMLEEEQGELKLGKISLELSEEESCHSICIADNLLCLDSDVYTSSDAETSWYYEGEKIEGYALLVSEGTDTTEIIYRNRKSNEVGFDGYGDEEVVDIMMRESYGLIYFFTYMDRYESEGWRLIRERRTVSGKSRFAN